MGGDRTLAVVGPRVPRRAAVRRPPGRPTAELAAHELAHQWFYGLVGNDQARDPWLDEGFATYAQAVADDTPDAYSADDVPKGLRGRLGDPMATWSDRGADAYYAGVYVQGAATLLDARDRVGAEAFDAAIRAYIAENAHRVATPATSPRSQRPARRSRRAHPRRSPLHPPG